MAPAPSPEIYQVQVWIRQISPMIWRIKLVPGLKCPPVMGQMAKGLKGSEAAPSTTEGEDVPGGPTPEALAQKLESLKWNLWHGNVYRALQRLEDLEGDIECLDTDTSNARSYSR